MNLRTTLSSLALGTSLVFLSVLDGCSSDESADPVDGSSSAGSSGVGSSSSGGRSSSSGGSSSGGSSSSSGGAGSSSSGSSGVVDDAGTELDAATDAGAECMAITVGAFAEDEGIFFASVQPMVVAGVNYLDVDLYNAGDVVGTHVLGAGANASLETCKQCVLLRAGDGSPGGGKRFFPRAGTLQITAVDLDEASLQGSLRDVVLEEVDIEAGGIPVEGGRCLRLASGTIAVP